MQYNIISSAGSGLPVKRKLTMEKLYSYIDSCIIPDYLSENFKIDIDDLTDHDRSNLLDIFMQNDTNLRQIALNHMQKLLDERLLKYEEDRYPEKKKFNN